VISGKGTAFVQCKNADCVLKPPAYFCDQQLKDETAAAPGVIDDADGPVGCLARSSPKTGFAFRDRAATQIRIDPK
jgi:hypothetical protein